MVSNTTGNKNDTDTNNDVQSYLISRYREALKAGDKSYAKSCLLSTRLFSVNDPSITYEIYLMAKSDNDACEAAKCFTSLINVMLAEDGSMNASINDDNVVVINQMKEEIRLLMNELKLHTLRLKSVQLSQLNTSGGQQTRLAPSVTQSPLLSPRRRMASEDRATSKDSMFRLDSHLHSTTKGFYYQQLFDNLPEKVKRNLCTYSIETCDNPFERCRLMMLTILLLNEAIPNLAPQLFKALMNLTHSNSTSSKALTDEESPRLSAISHYAGSMLVLDAIPLVFSLNESDNLNVELDELICITLRYYSEHCLENATSEYEFDELHEGLKKTIAARILGKELNIMPDDPVEEILITSLNLLMDKLLLDLPSNDGLKKKFKKLRMLIAEQIGNKSAASSLIPTVEAIESEFPYRKGLNIFESQSLKGDEQEAGKTISQAVATNSATPSKGRGRPKKVVQSSSVIVSSDDVARENFNNKKREYRFVMFSLTQLLFQLSSQYLKQVKSRILIEFDNPLSRLVEFDLSKSNTQRASRLKSSSQSESNSVSPKKFKPETCNNAVTVSNMSNRISKNSPLNSEQSKKLDNETMLLLDVIFKCDLYLREVAILVAEFKVLLDLQPPPWLRRIRTDINIRKGSFESPLDDLSCLAEDKLHITKESKDAETSTMTVTTGPSTVNAQQLRAITQLISCQIQQKTKQDAFSSIDKLLSKIRLSGLLTHDGGYSLGNIIEEYMILLDTTTTTNNNIDTSSTNTRHLGFLFFDTLSMIRYTVDILIDILKIYVNCPLVVSDTVIGHAIVLCQFDWPKEAPLYERCIAWIQASKPKSITPQCLSASTKFTYPQFFQYVSNPHIIEDFMALLNEGYTLDITGGDNAMTTFAQASHQSSKSSATPERASTRAGKTMTTRGVNRNFKDQLKCMLIDQMENSSNLVPLDLITGFIQVSLLPFLNDEDLKKR